MESEEAGARVGEGSPQTAQADADDGPERAEGGQDDEGHVPRVFTSPGQPSAIERAKHKATHIPFRSWCSHCVRGRGRDRQHRLCSGYDQNGHWATPEPPRVGMDYGFFSTNDLGEDCEADKGTIKMTLLAVKETLCDSVWSYCVRHKGVLQEPWIAKQIMHDFDTVGLANERIIIKNDQESNIVALQHEIKRRRATHGTALDEGRVGDSNSNARAEVAVQEVKGMIRTLRSALEGNIGARIGLDHPIVPWLVRFAGTNITRFQVRADGKTSFEKMKGYRGVMPVGEFGEVVHFRLPNATASGGYIDRYEDGVWLGYDLRSGENIIGTGRGVFRTGSVRRRPPDEMWSKHLLDEIVGDPENPVPGGDAGRPPTWTKAEAAAAAAPPVVVFQAPVDAPEIQARGVYIRRTDVTTHGATESCAACRYAMLGKPSNRSHSHKCRARFELILAEDEEGKVRLERANERQNEAVARESDKIFDEAKKRKLEVSAQGPSSVEDVPELVTDVVRAADDDDRATGSRINH